MLAMMNAATGFVRHQAGRLFVAGLHCVVFHAAVSPALINRMIRMSDTPPNDPLHGMTLEKILLALVERFGWPELGRRIAIRCFNQDPSIKSSLVFLRRTPWARAQVEALFIEMKTRPSTAVGKDGRPRLFAPKQG